jgi:hypothetical protein
MVSRADDRLRVAVKYLTIGLIIGLFCAPHAGAQTIKACVASLQDLFGTLGGDEFAEPSSD